MTSATQARIRRMTQAELNASADREIRLLQLEARKIDRERKRATKIARRSFFGRFVESLAT